ncbi:MAG: hypothetical protein MK078_02365 [Crocinitomicaceae bacterium]|nr:hypothetical protein [Crocinitomicaceae bacterium]
MAEEKGYIEKKKSGSGIHQELFAEGIEILQKLSGKKWTDYNHHDPGITLLESTVYAMTELDYKSNNKMRDLLIKEPEHKLQSGDNGMFVAGDILTTNPVTIDDLRKIIVDRVPSVKNVWVSNLSTTHTFKDAEVELKSISGLYSVNVEIEYVSKELFKQEKSIVQERIKSIFEEHRNICELLYDINVFDPYEIKFRVDLNIEETANGESLLAEAINLLNANLSQEVQFKSLWEIENDYAVEDIFNGPKLNNGFVLDSSLKDRVQKVDILELINLIGSIGGIISVNSLEILHQPNGPKTEWVELDKDFIEIPEYHFPSLRIPEKNEDVVFRTAGLRYHADMNEVINELAYIESVKYGNLKSGSKKSNELEIPEGDYLNIESYYPVRHHLPDHYGVGQNGLITGLEDKRYAQANQLKSYLMPIDQVMANMLKQIANVNELYDVSENNLNSYYNQALEDTEEHLHLLDVDRKLKKRDQLHDWHDKLNELDRKYDTHNTDRFERVSNDLLARFSEKYPSYSLSKSYSQLYPFLTQTEISKKILKAKRAYINDYDSISYNRGKSCDYRALGHAIINGDEDNQGLPGIVQKMASLIDIKNAAVRSLCKTVEDSGISIYQADESIDEKLKELNIKDDEETRMSIQEYPSFLEEELEIKDGFFFHSSPNDLLNDVMRYGINANNYVLKHLQKQRKKISQVWLNYEDSSLLIHANKKGKKAQEFLDKCVETLRNVNENSEGIFFVERMLLLPKLNENNFGFSIDLSQFNISIGLENKELESIGERHKTLGKILNGLITGNIELSISEHVNSYRLEIIHESKVLAVSREQVQKNELGSFVKQVDSILPMFKEMSLSSLRSFVKSIQKWVYYGTEKVNEEFFTSKISFVMPSWPTRFQDANFKEFFSGLIYKELPIHLVAQDYWLNFNEMKKFEAIYIPWIESFANDIKTQKESSLELVKFIQLLDQTLDAK